jgi:hypothetical protein
MEGVMMLSMSCHKVEKFKKERNVVSFMCKMEIIVMLLIIYLTSASVVTVGKEIVDLYLTA